jgi:predicted component of type VI protein secretion system
MKKKESVIEIYQRNFNERIISSAPNGRIRIKIKNKEEELNKTMNIQITIKDGKDTTTHNADFTPTEEAIGKAVKNAISFLKNISPTITKTTTHTEDLTNKDKDKS